RRVDEGTSPIYFTHKIFVPFRPERDADDNIRLVHQLCPRAEYRDVGMPDHKGSLAREPRRQALVIAVEPGDQLMPCLLPAKIQTTGEPATLAVSDRDHTPVSPREGLNDVPRPIG